MSRKGLNTNDTSMMTGEIILFKKKTIIHKISNEIFVCVRPECGQSKS